MKTQRFILTIMMLAALLASCKHEVDLYAEYREIPIIYGVLEAEADTNFIKITRVFCASGDAYQIAQNPDSSNYPGKLDARLTEFRNGQKTREIILDTITIRDKQEGVFYAPAQKLYYTAEPLCKNSSGERYVYQLTVVFPHDTITMRCDMVGNDGFRVQSLGFNFSKENFFRRRDFRFWPATNGSLYHFSLAFTFLEQRVPGGDSVPRTMYWDLYDYDDNYLSTHTIEGCYVFNYFANAFYDALADFIGGDTAIVGLKRYITDYPIELSMSACGHNLQQYLYYNDPSHLVPPGDLEFSLIPGAYGVFSSRMTHKTELRLAGTTVPDLQAMTNWGFKYIGGPLPDEL